MLELLWLLLPAAAASGWYAARHASPRHGATGAAAMPGEYIQGVKFLLNEQPDKALEVFIRIAEVDSETVETHFVLGSLFRRRGEVERAIRLHQSVIARASLDARHRADALLELGRDYLSAGLLDRAEALFEEVIQLGTDDAQAYRHLRTLYEQEKDWDKAIEAAVHLQAVTGHSQARVIAHYYCELGEAKAHAKHNAAAAGLARRALRYDPRCARASILLGDLAFDSAHDQAAITHYTQVSAQHPELLSLVLDKLRQSFVRQGREHDYVRFLERVTGEHHNLSSVLSLIESLRSHGQRASAEAMFEAELERPRVPLEIVRAFALSRDADASGKPARGFKLVAAALETHLAGSASHRCGQCGFETRTLFWQCPSCHRWGSITPIEQAGGAPERRAPAARSQTA